LHCGAKGPGGMPPFPQESFEKQMLEYCILKQFMHTLKMLIILIVSKYSTLPIRSGVALQNLLMVQAHDATAQ